MNALSENLQSLLGRIVDVLSSDTPAPPDLIKELEDCWRRERPDDIQGLTALVRCLRARSDEERLKAAEDDIEQTYAKAVSDVGEWRRSGIARELKAEPAEQNEGSGWLYPVYFGTNRAANDLRDPAKGFGIRRASEVTCGRCNVWVPATHCFGETGKPWWQRWRHLQFTDDHLRLHEIAVLEPADFFAEIRREMQQAAGEQPHGLVYLHGYNVSFHDAAIRAAQIGFDLKVSGATAFFSWPSQGRLRGYPADAASIEASEDAIVRFLAGFSRQSGAEVVHIVAHSMGNRGLLRALQRLAADAELQAGVRFGQIFLAAPDVDKDLFLSLAKLYPQFSDRTTLYASDADRALATSAWLHDDCRAGYCPPVTVPGLDRFDTISVPNFNLDLLGHSYYAEADALLYDMSELMRRNTPPGGRPRIRAIDNYWQIGE